MDMDFCQTPYCYDVSNNTERYLSLATYMYKIIDCGCDCGIYAMCYVTIRTSTCYSDQRKCIENALAYCF